MKNNQIKNLERKKKLQDREEFGFGYDIGVDDLKILGQNEVAKAHNAKGAGAIHPVNNDKKNNKG